MSTTTTGPGRRAPLRAAYLDLDGTLLGRAGALLRDGDGDFSLLGVRALEACARAGVEAVLVSGRHRGGMHEMARLLGLSAYACDAGALLVVDGEEHWLTGDIQPRGDRTVFDLITETGAPDVVTGHGLHVLEISAVTHDISHVFYGDGDADAIQADLDAAGHTGLRVLDNGPAEEGGHIFHLLPKAASKAAAVEAHQRIRGFARDETIAVGDSAEDAGMAATAGTYWTVANGAWAAGSNVRRAEGTHGDGVYEAIVTELAERK